MVELKTSGEFKNTFKFFDKLLDHTKWDILDKYGRMGVDALAKATPVDTGKTARSWSYEVTRSKERYTLTFKNNNINKGVPVAVILQYGHGTGTGGWVEGTDYINPALKPVFEEIKNKLWKEVKSR